MAISCPYCAQTNTIKDKYGYCKKYNCFEVSGTKTKLENLKKEFAKAKELPTSKQNQFDGSYYNPRQDEIKWILKKITSLTGYVPLEIL